MAMMAMPMLATHPANVKRPHGIKIPLKEIPTMPIDRKPTIKPYSLDGLFDYNAFLSENTLWILVQENVGTTHVRIENAGGIVYETTESVFAGDIIEIPLTGWQTVLQLLRAKEIICLPIANVLQHTLTIINGTMNQIKM